MQGQTVVQPPLEQLARLQQGTSRRSRFDAEWKEKILAHRAAIPKAKSAG
jgi:hypothetical protein